MPKKTTKKFKEHWMYDPKTGKRVRAETHKAHLALSAKGYTHSPPKRKSFTEAVEKRMGGGYR